MHSMSPLHDLEVASALKEMTMPPAKRGNANEKNSSFPMLIFAVGRLGAPGSGEIRRSGQDLCQRSRRITSEGYEHEGLKANSTIVIVPSSAVETMQLGGLAGMTASTMGLGQERASKERESELKSSNNGANKISTAA